MRNDYLLGTMVLTGVSWEWVGVGKESSGRNYWSRFLRSHQNESRRKTCNRKAIFVPCQLVEGYVNKSWETLTLNIREVFRSKILGQIKIIESKQAKWNWLEGGIKSV